MKNEEDFFMQNDLADYVRRLRLTVHDRTKGYTRAAFRKDVIYGFFRIREISISVSKKNMTVTRVTDGMAERMLTQKMITDAQYERYIKYLTEELYHIDRFDSLPIEDLYAHIGALRRAVLGDAVDTFLLELARSSPAFVSNGIDQGAKKAELLKKKHAVILAITQAELFSLMQKDLALAMGNEVWVLCDTVLQPLLPKNVHLLTLDENGISFDAGLQAYVDAGEACLFVYGEEGLTACRDLLVDSVVHAVPIGYCAKAVTDLWNEEGCTVYVPRGMDMTANVPITQKTKLNYRILSKLWEAYGDAVYSMDLPALYRQYPAYFFNVYSGKRSELPLSFPSDVANVCFNRLLDEAVENYLNHFENVEYRSAYFDGYPLSDEL